MNIKERYDENLTGFTNSSSLQVRTYYKVIIVNFLATSSIIDLHISRQQA